MFLQITEGLWSHCTPHCQGLRQAHAICQIDGKVAEWGWDTLCWSTLLSFMCHIWMSRESHTFVICCWDPPERLAAAAYKHTHTHRQGRIVVLRNYSYLWASVSKWDNYRHPLTAISGFHPLFQGPGNHCHVGPFMPNQWEGFHCSWV